MATYKFPQFNVEIINPTVTVTIVTDDIINRVCSANVLLTTPSAIFGIDFNGIKFYQIPAFSNAKSGWDEKKVLLIK